MRGGCKQTARYSWEGREKAPVLRQGGMTQRGFSRSMIIIATRSRLGRFGQKGKKQLGRVQGGAVLLDVRTIFPEQEDGVIEAVRAAVG